VLPPSSPISTSWAWRFKETCFKCIAYPNNI